jgi:SPP1 gp7 family putative phage head morphogenesis protein
MAWYLAAKAGSRITGMSVTMTELIGRTIFELVQQGKDTRTIAREIQQLAPEISKGRAAVIARTETHNAALAAIEETARYRRIPVSSKTWHAVMDEKTRPAHAAAHGQTVPFGAMFNVGGVSMSRPGDESAPAELVINCRCSLLLHT